MGNGKFLRYTDFHRYPENQLRSTTFSKASILKMFHGRVAFLYTIIVTLY